jgi:transcriptional regulator GlxA family with amidase domain
MDPLSLVEVNLSHPLRIAFLLCDRVEELDFVGPFEVFGAVRCITPDQGNDPLVSLFTVAPDPGPIRAWHGLRIVPDFTIDNSPPADVTIVPGGAGARALVDDERVVGWLKRQREAGQTIMSVCTGSFLLAAAGLLDGITCTTHWSCIDRMRQMFPQLTILEGERFVDNGKIITSAGVSAGLDAALHLVGRHFGEEKARAVARYIEYDYRPTLHGARF